MACLPPLDAWEQQLAGVLEATAAWRIDGQALELIDGDGAAIATFRAVYLP
jgi:heat shock protein HslJ